MLQLSNPDLLQHKLSLCVSSRRQEINFTVGDSAELPLDDEGRDLVSLDPRLGVDDRGLSEHGEYLKLKKNDRVDRFVKKLN